MSNRNDYTSEEWTQLLLAPIEAGAAVAFVGKSGFFGSAQEMLTLHNATSKGAAQRYPGNELVQSLLTSDTKATYGEVLQKVEAYLKDEESRNRLRAEAMQMGQHIASILAQKATPHEAQGYKQWLLDVCSRVANAASEGGQRVSPEEEKILQELQSALA